MMDTGVINYLLSVRFLGSGSVRALRKIWKNQLNVIDMRG
jgi:hypothetical protein